MTTLDPFPYFFLEFNTLRYGADMTGKAASPLCRYRYPDEGEKHGFCEKICELH